MRILMLGPWPIERPRHGGQIRADQIRAAYRDHGHEVVFVGIFDPNTTEEADIGPCDLKIDETVMKYIADSGEHWEISLWDAFAAVPELFSHFANLVAKFKPDIVQVEEPYLWPVAEALRTRGLIRDTRIVYSAYNFETSYRRELAKIAGPVNERSLAKVARQEIELAAQCDLIVAVSDGDAHSFRDIGARAVVVARNGCRVIQADADALKSVDAYFGGKPYALFVSSAHPPNAEGLLDFSGSPPKEMLGSLVVCGSVCNLLAPRVKEFHLLRRARLFGVVDVPLLDALLVRAAVILLPKTRGGGSNLKTSEALLALRPVVGTSQAFVGFEPWYKGGGVTIADDPTAFWRATLRHLRGEVSEAPLEWAQERNGLRWTTCLEPLVEAVESLVGRPLASRSKATEN